MFYSDSKASSLNLFRSHLCFEGIQNVLPVLNGLHSMVNTITTGIAVDVSLDRHYIVFYGILAHIE